MIIKNKETTTSIDARQLAGDKQEQDVAFFLRRAFKDRKKIFVFNDLKIEHNDEVAQIDHLILYVYGFILIESKSVTGEVNVNADEEWSRSYNGKWSGIRSPIKQVELQQKLLRELLWENKKQLLPKKLFGKIQQSFGMRCWDNICAISSNAIAHRDTMPKTISKQLVKSEFLVDKINEVMNLPSNKVTDLFSLNARPDFSANDMQSICSFLIARHQSSSSIVKDIENNEQLVANTKVEQIIEQSHEEKNSPSEKIQTLNEIVTTNSITKLVCKKCNATDTLQAVWGKFGYYVKCSACETNTAMKRPCPSCSSKNTKVCKTKAHYHLECQDCNEHSEIFVQ